MKVSELKGGEHLKIELSKNQEKLLIALMTTATIKDASAQAGITTATAYKYLNDPVFKEEYRRVRREAFEQATSKIVGSVDEAVEVLRTVMNDEEEVGATRVQAARTIIANAFKSYEMQEVQERLDELEDLIREGQA